MKFLDKFSTQIASIMAPILMTFFYFMKGYLDKWIIGLNNGNLMLGMDTMVN